MSSFGKMAAWPDPVSVSTIWNMTDAEVTASPLQHHRVKAGEECRVWRDAAAADGWNITPTYGNHETVDTAWSGERDGFKVMGICRPAGHCGARLATAGLSLWGPDELAIKPMPVYNFDAIKAGAETCLGCGAHPVITERVAFAGRYCAVCAPIERQTQERPGWCD